MTAPSLPTDRDSLVRMAAYLRAERRGFASGYEIEDCCPACQRAGHYGNWSQGESPCAAVPTANADMNLSWEYYGNWRQTRRTEDGWVPVGGFRTIVVSQKARWAFIQLGVRRIVWVPMRTAPPAG